MKITHELAQNIVDKTMKILGKNINIMNEKGIIIGSGNKGRLNQFHEGAARVIKEKRKLEIYSKDIDSLAGAKPGINLPIEHNKNRKAPQENESAEYLFNDAYRLDRQRQELEARVFYRRFNLLRKRLLNFSCETYNSEKWQLIANRLFKHYDEILTFLEVSGLPKDNNHAERMM